MQLIELENAMGSKNSLSIIRKGESSSKDMNMDNSVDLLSDSIQDIFDDRAEYKLCIKENELLKMKLSKI